MILNLKHAPRGVKDGSVVYNGLRTSAGSSCAPARAATWRSTPTTAAGNVSAPARRTVSLAALIPLRPLTGSSVTSRAPHDLEGPGGHRVLQRAGLPKWQAHPRGLAVGGVVPAARTYLLAPGIYTWYVWPAFKHANAATTFGDLIGRATFVYAK